MLTEYLAFLALSSDIKSQYTKVTVIMSLSHLLLGLESKAKPRREVFGRNGSKYTYTYNYKPKRFLKRSSFSKCKKAEDLYSHELPTIVITPAFHIFMFSNLNESRCHNA